MFTVFLSLVRLYIICPPFRNYLVLQCLTFHLTHTRARDSAGHFAAEKGENDEILRQKGGEMEGKWWENGCFFLNIDKF